MVDGLPVCVRTAAGFQLNERGMLAVTRCAMQIIFTLAVYFRDFITTKGTANSITSHNNYQNE